MTNLLKAAPAVVCLLAINIGIYLINVVIGPQASEMISSFALYYFDSPSFNAYQIITHMFLHGSFVHLLFNMFALFVFGSQLELIWRTKRFIIFYFVTGLGAVFLHQAVLAFEVLQISGSITPNSDLNLLSALSSSAYRELQFKYFVPVVGASGAIYGLLLAYAVMFPNAKLMFLLLPVPIKAKYLIPVLMAAELFLGVRQYSFDNIAHFAHLGGALFGFILVKLWSHKLPKNLPPSD